MPAARNVLVVGGGVAGMTSAMMLARAGVDVTLIELDPDWRVAGAGITITAATLRALKTIGVLDRVMDEGHTHDGIRVCGTDGVQIDSVLSPSLGPGIPGAGGILRPVLHAILADQVRAAGVTVKLGVTVEGFAQDPAGVDVRMTDGTAQRFDCVVGADGIRSSVRARLFPASPAAIFTGQACWRLTLARPVEIDKRHFFLGGPVKCGLTPVSRDEMYLFLLEPVPDNPWREPSEQHHILHGLLTGFGGILAHIREELSTNARIVYRPIEGHVLRHDWFTGRVIVTGDAAHASSPQLASGAGMSLEDGIVFAEEIARVDSVDAAFRGFMQRRYERCRMVADNSLEIGRLEMTKAPPQQQTEIVARSLAALATPI
jgi:2-polyprenyl-6-methoxyphenol hydroxylase-like FAD-dependent oxidoreductase